MHPRLGARDPRCLGAEVDLDLLAWRCFEAHRRQGLGFKLLAIDFDSSLDRAQTHDDSELVCQVLTHDIGVAVVLRKPRLEPIRRHAGERALSSGTAASV